MTLVLGASRYFAFLRLLRLTDPATVEWQDELREAQGAMGIKKPVELRVSQDAGPCLVRRLNGSCVVVPRGLWGDLDRSQRRAILRHELAHHVRGDLWKSIAMRLLSLPQWFNPAAWWAVRRFDECAEWACDELAAGDGEGATEYSKLLLALGTAPGGRAAYLPAAHRGCVSTRVRRLVAERRCDGRTARVLVPLVVVALIAVAVLRIDVVAQPVSSTGNDAPAALPVGDFSPMPWHPEELLAVLGDERGQTWGYPGGLVVTAGGSRVILATRNGTLLVYDAHSMAMISTFGEGRASARHLQLAGDGERLIVGYDDQAVELWDITRERPVLVQTVHLPVDDPEAVVVNFGSSRNADRFVGSTGRLVSVWELRRGRLKQIHSVDIGEETAFACLLSADGEWLLTKSQRVLKEPEPVSPDRLVEVNGKSYVRSDCTLRVWDVSGSNAKETDRVVTTNVYVPRFSPDGSAVFATPDFTEPDRGLRQWNFVDGKLQEAEDLAVKLGSYSEMAFSPDGRLLAGRLKDCYGQDSVMDIGQKPWRETATLPIDGNHLASIAFTPGGEAIVMCVDFSLQRWNRSDSGDFDRVTPEPIESRGIADILFSRDGGRLISCGSNSVREWNLLQPGSHQPIVTDLDKTGYGTMAWVPGRDAFISQTSTDQQRIQLWERTDGRFREEWSIDLGSDLQESAWCHAIDPRGRLMAVGHHDATISFWDVEGDSPVKTAELERAHGGYVRDIEFSPDGTMLASVGYDGAVKLWDPSTDPPSEANWANTRKPCTASRSRPIPAGWRRVMTPESSASGTCNRRISPGRRSAIPTTSRHPVQPTFAVRSMTWNSHPTTAGCFPPTT